MSIARGAGLIDRDAHDEDIGNKHAAVRKLEHHLSELVQLLNPSIDNNVTIYTASDRTAIRRCLRFFSDQLSGRSTANVAVGYWLEK